MALGRMEKILILAKTYPSPSARHTETSCIAGITEHGRMRRLYPVPFRFMADSARFKKWQWIEVRTEKAGDDRRSESHKIYIDTVKCGEVIGTDRSWADRRSWLDKIPDFSRLPDTDNSDRAATSPSLALLRPAQLLRLEICKAKAPDWTPQERAKLLRAQMQERLFSEDEARRQITQLRKLPFDFYWNCTCAMPDGAKECRYKIVDWEAGALFWNCQKKYGDAWEPCFRTMMQERLGSRDWMFLMGNQHRFQNQWLIISLIYPPKPAPSGGRQMPLL